MSLTAVAEVMMDSPDSTGSMAESSTSNYVYPSAVLIAVFAFILSVLIAPPMVWHARNRNIGATSLIFWILILNLQTFLNALIWRTDEIDNWFSGYVLCDIEVKIQVASEIGFPSSAACVLRALAKVMNTDKVTMSTTKVQRRRAYAIDILWCAGFPLLQMLFHYIVQVRRYYIYGISGCVPAISYSWVTDVLIITPPMFWTAACAFYAGLVLVRLHRYRRTFNTLLAHSNTNKSRFLRLFLLCMAWLAVSIPLEGYVIAQQTKTPRVPFVWTDIHNSTRWEAIPRYPSNGHVSYTRYVWLGAGVCVFLFFGFGRDATRMYAQGLRALGLGRCFPALRLESQSRATTTHNSRAASAAGTFTSVSSKARMLFTRKSGVATDSQKTWATDSRSSNLSASADAEPVSPCTMTFLETVHEDSGRPAPETAETGKARLSTWLRAHGPPQFRSPKFDAEGGRGVPLGDIERQDANSWPSGSRSPGVGSAGSGKRPEVYVKKEFQVSSESAGV